MKALAAWCCFMQTTFAVNRPGMIHRARPAVDHSSSLLMAPTISSSEITFEHAEKVPSILDRLKSATSFRSLRSKAVSLCPHSDNSTEVCSGHGVCTDDLRCICSAGYGGADCSTPNKCPSSCSGAGVCNQFGICQCHADFAGESCSQKFCPKQCSRHGVCDPPNGCKCFDGWSGPACDVSTCPNSCSGHGVCQNSTCTCNGNWTDPDCSRPRCSSFCKNGQCNNGVCECDAGWVGGACSLSACLGDADVAISPTGETLEVCGPHGSCGADGQCVCNAGWGGDKCSVQICPQSCGAHAKCVDGRCVCVGDACPKVKCLDSANDCSGHGVCFRNVCVCAKGFAGETCNLKICPNDCSGQGKCVDGKCQCNPSFRGEDCSARTCPTALSSGGVDTYFTDGGSVLLKRRKLESGNGTIEPAITKDKALETWKRLVGPSVCSGHGVCQDDGTCNCDAGWQNPACSAMMCPEDCNDHGVCENFKCKCDNGWQGYSCATRSCGLECEKNHGSCDNGKCVCFSGWGGTACNQRLCEPACSEHGRCVDGKCFCEDGWGGNTCAGHLCHQTCSTHGRCVNNTCLCENGWRGKDCTQRTCPGDCSNHGTCQSDGKCACTGYFTGKDCSVCNTTKYSGPNCDQLRCPDDCSGNGICKEGSCYCSAEYTGQTCAIKSCPMLCNKRGICKNATCQCQPGFFGSACELGHNRTCPDQCGGHGKCDITTGKCTCEPGYTGKGCTLFMCKFGCSGNGQCFNHTCKCKEGFIGAGCETSVCPLNCTGNGMCVGGRCFCQPNWTGTACEVKVCPAQCSNHGTCNDGVCTCHDEWTGLDCSQTVGIYVGETIEVPIKGRVYIGVVVASREVIRVNFNESAHVPHGKLVGKGIEQRAWLPKQLAQLKCRDCSGRGTCTGYKCECLLGFEGKFCERQTKIQTNVTKVQTPAVVAPVYSPAVAKDQFPQVVNATGSNLCARNCSNHGLCNRGVCVCKPGWSGSLCGCPTLLDATNLPTHLSSPHLRAVQNFNNVCSGHGRCVNNKCECEPKWTSFSCGTPAWMVPSYNCAAECVFTCMRKCSTTGDLAPKSRLRGDNDCYLRCSKRCNADCLAEGQPMQ